MLQGNKAKVQGANKEGQEEMKQPNTITVAMMKSPDSNGWIAQIHMEYPETKAKDVNQCKGDNPVQLLNYCTAKVERRLEKIASDKN